MIRELEKLSEESLTRQPEEVFDILCKLGEGSYGSVFKALHKESRQILAIKQVGMIIELPFYETYVIWNSLKSQSNDKTLCTYPYDVRLNDF
jgi:hypothetical protein